MRQMRKWQKQFGNRTDPRQHVQQISNKLFILLFFPSSLLKATS
jgi:hypothetical protein